MKLRSSIKLIFGIVSLFLIILSPIPFLQATSKPTASYFDIWNPTRTSCGDHENVKNTEVAGEIVITTPDFVEPSESFLITLQISGFTEAPAKNRENKIVLGLDKDDANNGLFILKTQAQDNYQVDSAGNSKHHMQLN